MASPTGTLVSLIAKPKPPKMLSSVHELVRQDEMPWLIEAGSAYTNFGVDAEEGTTMKCEHIFRNFMIEFMRFQLTFNLHIQDIP